ncbi:polyprenyl synthetase family protein [Saccharopolyspora sp. NPDC002376]
MTTSHSVTAEATSKDTVVESSLPDQVQQKLTEFLQSRRSEALDLDPAFGAAVAELAGFVLNGGKRIRPTFAWWGWRAAGGSAEGPAAVAMLRAASALELIQACALVHDDLIDESDTRRGNPTVHRKFEQVHQESGFTGDAEQFGMASAVLLGDLALTWADDMLHSAGIPPTALNRALRPWRAMRTEVLAGQYLDVLGQVRGDETPQAALRICQLKAASYTVQRPLELGAEIAGASPEALEALRRFGSDIGVAFQLRDDLLGVFGDPEVTGKPAGDDLREGKRTVLIAEATATAREQNDQEALGLLHSVLGDPELDEQRVEQARQVLTRLGAVAAVEKRITDLTGSALLALHGANLAEPATSRLAELAVAVTDRTR